ncbi:MAG: glycosyltransferase family protein [Candidatus Helarchaeales archaeon]
MKIILSRQNEVTIEIFEELKRLGHEPIFIGMKNIKKLDADLVMILPPTPYDKKTFDNIKKQKIPIIYWSRNGRAEDDINLIKNSDYVFLPYKTVKHYYLPLYCNPFAIKGLKRNEKYDVCTLSSLQMNYPYRRKYKIKIKEIFINMPFSHLAVGRHFKMFLNDYRKRYNVYLKSKIAINIANCEDALPLRYFESVMCKCLPINYYIPQLEELFPMKHMPKTFRLETPVNEIYDEIRYYLENENERKRISLILHRHVIKHHTLRKRIETILKTVKK